MANSGWVLNRLEILAATRDVKVRPLSNRRTQGLPCHETTFWRRNKAVALAVAEEKKLTQPIWSSG